MSAEQPAPPRTKAAQREATVAALTAAARTLFAERGYAGVGTEEIVQRAGVTRGALYHHFKGGKEELFRAVLVQVGAETTARVLAAANSADDPWDELVLGIEAFLDASAIPEVQQIMLVDGPSVLGWDVWRETGEVSVRLTEQVLQAAMDAGRIVPTPARPLAHVLIGAVDEAAMVVARADDPLAAREEMGQHRAATARGTAKPGAVGRMLVRTEDSGTLLIGQPSHAWISGQLARAWGNPAFGPVKPFEEVCLAAEQHDIGMAEWDLTPTFNPETGLPHSFIEMPISAHLPLWREAPRRLLRQSRYATLLTSMHGVRLYGLRDLDRLPAEDAARSGSTSTGSVRGRRGWGHRSAVARGGRATRSLGTASSCGHGTTCRWRCVLAGRRAPWPTCRRRRSRSRWRCARGPAPGQVIVDPWPFRHAEAFTVRCEGQRLTERVDSSDALATRSRRRPVGDARGRADA